MLPGTLEEVSRKARIAQTEVMEGISATTSGVRNGSTLAFVSKSWSLEAVTADIVRAWEWH